MIMEMSFLGDLREEINAMPNFLFSLSLCSKSHSFSLKMS